MPGRAAPARRRMSKCAPCGRNTVCKGPTGACRSGTFNQSYVLDERGLCTLVHSALTKRRHALSLKRQTKDPGGRDQLALLAKGWRRRRNRPGNAQAKGPLGDDTLESDL